MEWTAYKNIKRMYEEDEQQYKFTYCNKGYTRRSASVVLLLLDEIHKDFPEESEDNIFIDNASNFPNEILLCFHMLKEEVSSRTLAKFKKISKKLD